MESNSTKCINARASKYLKAIRYIFSESYQNYVHIISLNMLVNLKKTS